jgi:uncharacterized protein (DUF697 family)
MRRMLSDLFVVVRELSLDALAQEASHPPSLLFVGEAAARERAARALLGAAGTPYVTFADAIPPDEQRRYDLVVILWHGSHGEVFRQQVATARRRGWPLLVLSLSEALPPPGSVSAGELIPLRLDSAEQVAAARRALVDAADENRRLALGRSLPDLRPVAATSLVEQTSRANAEFAALSGVAGLLPLLGNVLAIGADFLVLTKNQLLLIFKLAAVYGRDLEERRQLYVEMVPVVGAALLWRTIARELAALLPGWLGIAPRVAIAYSGTYVVGRAAHHYYALGRPPAREDWARFYGETKHRLRDLLSQRGRQGGQAVPASDQTLVQAPPSGLAGDVTIH